MIWNGGAAFNLRKHTRASKRKVETHAYTVETQNYVILEGNKVYSVYDFKLTFTSNLFYYYEDTHKSNPALGKRTRSKKM